MAQKISGILLAAVLWTSCVVPSQLAVQTVGQPFTQEIRTFLCRLYDLPDEIFTLPKDLQYLIVGKCDNPLFPLPLGEPKQSFRRENLSGSHVRISPTSQKLAFFARNRWDLFDRCDETGVWHISDDPHVGHARPSACGQFNPNGKEFVYMWDCKALKKVHIASRKTSYVIASLLKGELRVFDFVDDTNIVVVNNEWVPRVVSLGGSAKLNFSERQDPEELCVPDGGYYSDYTYVETRSKLAHRPVHVFVAHDGAIILVGNYGGVYRYDLETDKEVALIQESSKTDNTAYASTVSPDRQTIFIAVSGGVLKRLGIVDGTIKEYNAFQDGSIRVLRSHAVRCSQDGTQLVVLWSKSDKNKNGFDIDGRFFAVYDSNLTSCRIIYPRGKKNKRLISDTIALHPSGRVLLSAGDDSVAFFDLFSGICVCVSKKRMGGVENWGGFNSIRRACTFSPDGTFFVVGSKSGGWFEVKEGVHLWDVDPLWHDLLPTIRGCILLEYFLYLTFIADLMVHISFEEILTQESSVVIKQARGGKKRTVYISFNEIRNAFTCLPEALQVALKRKYKH